MMFLINPLFQFGHNISTALTDSVIQISEINKGKTAETSISKSIINAMIYRDETKEKDRKYLINHWQDVDINETDGNILNGGKKYKYSVNFFMLIVISVVTIFLLFFIAIQMAKRVMEVALFKILGPFCCTSLTNNGKSFEVWCKSTMGLFMVTVVQFVGIGLLLAMFETAFKDNGTLVGIFLVIGALLFIISTPTMVSSLLGQQSGMMSAFGDMQSLIALGTAGSQGLGLAKVGTMGALSMGSSVIGKSGNIMTGGIDRISGMLSKGKQLSNEQMGMVKESLNKHNSYKASQQISSFLNQNKGKQDNISTQNFNQPFNINHNMLKDLSITKEVVNNVSDSQKH